MRTLSRQKTRGAARTVPPEEAWAWSPQKMQTVKMKSVRIMIRYQDSLLVRERKGRLSTFF